MYKVYIYREFDSVRDAFLRLSKLKVLPFNNVQPLYGLRQWAIALTDLSSNKDEPMPTLVYRTGLNDDKEILIWGTPDGRMAIKVVDAKHVVWAVEGMVIPDATPDKVLQQLIPDDWLVWNWHPPVGDITTDLDPLLFDGDGDPKSTGQNPFGPDRTAVG